MIKIEQISLCLSGRAILSNVSIRLEKGERVALLGPSGTGKTTLLRIIAGLIRPDSGFVRIDTDRIAYMFQEARLLPWMTAEDNVNLVLGGSRETLPEARKILNEFGLSEAAQQVPAELSGGMQQRVALARTAVYDAELVLLDEPFSALDAVSKEQVIRKLNMRLNGKTVLMVTHDLREAEAMHCRVISMKE